MDTNKKPIIQFNSFQFHYFSQAEPTLHDINLTIYEGEKVLIVGPSGSGKSTLGNCLNGLIPFAYKGEIEGSLKINGRETREMNIFELSKMVGTVLQDADGQFIGLTVGEDIAFALENDCVDQGKMKEAVQKVADMVDMGNLLKSSPFELSGGQKQRVSFAGVMVDDVDIRKFGSQGQQRTSALSLKLSEIDLVRKSIHDTPVLLLDDVLSELDSNRQNYLLNSIAKIQTVITCTGLEEFVKNRFCINKIFQVINGTVYEKESVEEI